MRSGSLSVCVFCGSASGSQIYRDIAHELGVSFAGAGVSLIYGGGKIGLMGIVADAVLAHGGSVTGVIPQFLIDLEVAHDRLTELIVVDSMHQRKAEMAARSDAFVALPGGFGTMEEFFEVLTWRQLELHAKPCILLNSNNYYTPLLQFLHASHEAGFISSQNMELLIVIDTVDELMSTIERLPNASGFQDERT